MYIKHAAIMYTSGEVVSGFDRYHKIIRLQAMLGISTNSDCIQGFVDGSDNFLTPTEAKAVAITAKQIPKDFDGKLYPEDLWPDPVFSEY